MSTSPDALLDALADTLSLGDLLLLLKDRIGAFQLADHWQQGEFHHDVVLVVDQWQGALPGPFLVVSTNCNGGVKEVLSLARVPSCDALWHWRCPENPEFEAEALRTLGISRTHHYFNPCELLGPDARSEIREEFRERQRGGGWRLS